jgi:hypothetical protein
MSHLITIHTRKHKSPPPFFSFLLNINAYIYIADWIYYIGQYRKVYNFSRLNKCKLINKLERAGINNMRALTLLIAICLL